MKKTFMDKMKGQRVLGAVFLLVLIVSLLNGVGCSSTELSPEPTPRPELKSEPTPTPRLEPTPTPRLEPTPTPTPTPEPTLTAERQSEECEDKGVEMAKEYVKDRIDGAKRMFGFVATYPTGDEDVYLYYRYEGEENMVALPFVRKHCIVLARFK